MLTIQPKISTQKINFGSDMEGVVIRPVYCEDCDGFVHENSENNYLNNVKDDIKETIDNLRDVKEMIPNEKGKKVVNGFMTLGAAALSGVSVKFGYEQTSKVLNKLFSKPSMKTLGGKLKKPFIGLYNFAKKHVGKLFEKFKTTKIFNKVTEKLNKFKENKFYTKSSEKLNKLKESDFGEKVLKIYQKIKSVKSAQVNNVVGSTLGVATGISTAVAKNLDKDSNSEEI